MFNPFKPRIDCPRCLGKGNVDWEDIKRLGQELRWIPGKCAYCDGKGKVAAGMPSKVSPDNSYLTTNIGPAERKRLFMGDEEAHQRARWFDVQMKNFLAQVDYLYHMGKMDAETIADFFLIERSDEDVPSEERLEFIDYISRIISRNKKQ